MHPFGAGDVSERKAMFKRGPKRPELQRLLEDARKVTLTADQLREQKVSFVYGNAPQGSPITKESARRSVDRIWLL